MGAVEAHHATGKGAPSTIRMLDTQLFKQCSRKTVVMQRQWRLTRKAAMAKAAKALHPRRHHGMEGRTNTRNHDTWMDRQGYGWVEGTMESRMTKHQDHECACAT